MTKPGAGVGSVIGNVLWFLTAGLWPALAHLVTGLLLCMTIIGIPFRIASFKMAGPAVAPLGRQMVPAAAVSGSQPVVAAGPAPLGH